MENLQTSALNDSESETNKASSKSEQNNNVLMNSKNPKKSNGTSEEIENNDNNEEFDFSDDDFNSANEDDDSDNDTLHGSSDNVANGELVDSEQNRRNTKDVTKSVVNDAQNLVLIDKKSFDQDDEEAEERKNSVERNREKCNLETDENRLHRIDSTATKTAEECHVGVSDEEDSVFYSDDEESDLLVTFLDKANEIAEARLAARRQARAEAREIRMRELERQQKEQEQNADRVFDMQTAAGIDPLSRSRHTLSAGSARGSSSLSSRRSSEDSLEEEGRSLRDIRHELKEVEERFRKAMIANAQLDNERASQSYQIQLLKDKLEEMEENFAQLQREYKEKCRDHNALKRNLDKVEEELKLVRGQLEERDTLITEQGLVIVMIENEDGSDAKRALVTVDNAQLLGSVQGSLDVRLKKFSEEKQELQKEVNNLQQQLAEVKTQRRGGSMNGPVGNDDEWDAQREANKLISEYKYKLQKAEQEIASLQASLARSETQVIRYKSTAEAAEKAEAELKIERRKLQRENREAMERLEELETSNNHLLKRLDKLKNAKSALLKDL